jgi:hypothetical protein
MGINLDSPSVQSYLAILQSVINRMAANSGACKTWCIGLVSAILIVAADKKRPELALVALLPVCLFAFLDAYYLALEKRFRASYVQFIGNVHSGAARTEDLFVIDPRFGIRRMSFDTLNAVGSMAIWPFYLLLLAMMFVVRLVAL